MTLTASRYDRWKAPAEDGRVLIWPDPTNILSQTRQNQRLFESAQASHIQNVPLPQVRQALRSWIGVEDPRQPLLATGHQTELHHPGVWAKNALIDSAAKHLDGQAFHFAVDIDAPKHLQMRWPGGSAALTDDPNDQADWSGLLRAPTPAHVGSVQERLTRAAAHWRFKPMVGDFLLSLRRLALESQGLGWVLTNAVHELDWSLGLRHHAMLVSPICESEPYLLFVHHILSRADAFSADYNAALDRYRAQNKIRSPGRPMPDLKCLDNGCEVPFWLDNLRQGTRSRAGVARVAGGFELRLEGGNSFFFDPLADGWTAADKLLGWLRTSQHRLAPRALTLTAVLRLLVADQFVHGIGGGQYDQVLDGLIARHFAMEPPRFSVTTATLYFPEAVGRSRICLPCIASEGHRLRHGVLGAEKMRMVGLISALSRRSPARSSLFFQMHDKLSDAWAGSRGREWEEHFRRSEALAQEERAIFDRELFYAIQTADRLQMLISNYRQAFA